MIDTLFGWYISEHLKGKFITVTFEESLVADDTDTLSLGDAVDGTALTLMLETDNFILFDVFAYADPGFVKVNVLPDNDTTLKFRVEATKNPTRVPIMPPKMAEVDLILDYTNESQPNDLYISFTAMRIPQANIDEFTLLSEVMPVTLQNIDIQTLQTVQLLQNLIALQQGQPQPFEVTLAKRLAAERKEFCKRR